MKSKYDAMYDMSVSKSVCVFLSRHNFHVYVMRIHMYMYSNGKANRQTNGVVAHKSALQQVSLFFDTNDIIH